MARHCYELRITGLGEGRGRIRMATLGRVSDALLLTAERATRLLATGSGSGRGRRPRWLAGTGAIYGSASRSVGRRVTSITTVPPRRP